MIRDDKVRDVSHTLVAIATAVTETRALCDVRAIGEDNFRLFYEVKKETPYRQTRDVRPSVTLYRRLNRYRIFIAFRENRRTASYIT
jgi:hypothetical protein